MTDLSSIDRVAGHSQIVARHYRPPEFYHNLFKRVVDVTLVLVASLIAIPLIAIFAILVARDGGQPFFVQKRVGRGRKVFPIVKLRSMVPDAEARLEAYLAENPEAADEWRRTQKLRDDPRVTTIGRFLRKTSIDELPQLWNVLIGQMSLVGPRPMLVAQRHLYPGTAYFRLRPGITGPWQISTRNQSEFASRADFDTNYEKSVSFTTDMSIVLRTIRVVVKGTGC